MSERVRDVKLGNVVIGHGKPLALIAGPCVLEEEDLTYRIAEQLKAIADAAGFPLIFKSSYEKDNRGTLTAYIGPGLDTGLRWLENVKKRFGIPVTSDIHRHEEAAPAAEVLDLLQIPAYLCQQTSLIKAVGSAGRPVNVKKGQFLAPENMDSAVGKLRGMGCDQILLTERGSCFGYNRLVSDMRSIPIMKDLGCPVVYDPTHIVRIYGVRSDDPAGGERKFVPTLTRAAVAAGVNAVFIETHPNCEKALCDAISMWPTSELQKLLLSIKPIAEAVREQGLA